MTGEATDIKATGSVTTVAEGTKTNTIVYTEGTNFKAENYTITKTEGKLKITPITDKVTVTITENSDSATYDGDTHTISGYKSMAADNDLYDVTTSVKATETAAWTVTKTDAGTYDMGIVAGDFENTNTNFANVEFVIVDGKLTITPVTVTLTSGDAKKVYDSKALTNEDVKGKNTNGLTVETGWVGTDGATYTFSGSQTLVGSSANTFSYTLKEGTIATNYTINKTEGTLTVTDGTGDDEDPVDPDLVVTKTAEDKAYALGEEVTFAITATNIYEEAKTITLSEIEGVSLKQSTFENVKGGDKIETTATYTITEADILEGGFINTVTATMDELVKTADATVKTEEPNGKLTVNKVTTNKPENGEAFVLGETIEYKITAINEGNLTISNVKVVDELTGDIWPAEGETLTLKPGESKDFETSYTVTEADVLAGSVKNVATATGTTEDPDDPDLEDDGDVEDPTEEPNGHLTVTKVATSTPANGEKYLQNEVITYKITVTNDGNLTITNVKVTDELTGDLWPAEGEAELILKPGEKAEFETSYTVTLEDTIKGSVLNVATAKGTSPDPENPDVPVEPGEDPEPTTPKENELIIRYWKDDELINTIDRIEPHGTHYDVVTPPIDGYTANIERVTGDLIQDTEIYDVVYTPIDYTLTILYRYNNGTVAAADYTATLHFGDAYSVQSPAINGFNTATQTVAGTMPAGNVTVTVIYVATNNVPLYTIDDFETPLGAGLGNINVGETIE